MAVEIKICGLTTLEDARVALDAGADYLGFVLYPRSPRAITLAQLCAIRAGLPAAARLVGVFVNETRERVLEVANAAGLFAVQLHGNEAFADFQALPQRVWRALRRGETDWLPEPAHWPAARYVVDAVAPEQYGGTGQRADWPAAAELAQRRVVMLAGGLTPDNVVAAIRSVRPVGVDVASGVEAVPGRKDPRQVAEFIRKAREAGNKLP